MYFGTLVNYKIFLCDEGVGCTKMKHGGPWCSDFKSKQCGIVGRRGGASHADRDDDASHTS